MDSQCDTCKHCKELGTCGWIDLTLATSIYNTEDTRLRIAAEQGACPGYEKHVMDTHIECKDCLWWEPETDTIGYCHAEPPFQGEFAQSGVTDWCAKAMEAGE